MDELTARRQDGIRGRQISTGELRARLQRLIPLKLTEPVLAVDGTYHFEAGQHVMAQYWGAGQVMLSPVFLEAGPPVMVIAHNIKAELL